MVFIILTWLRTNKKKITPYNIQCTTKYASLPLSPRLPKPDEPLLLIQVEFSSGRQGLFQTLSMTKKQTPASHLVGQRIFMTMDDGVDVVLLRAIERLDVLVPGVPECAFVHVFGRVSFFGGGGRQFNELYETNKGRPKPRTK